LLSPPPEDDGEEFELLLRLLRDPVELTFTRGRSCPSACCMTVELVF
jgi:hypothetical protein